MSEKTSQNQNIKNYDLTVESSKYIEVTKRTVKFGRKVYQFSNITGFGLAEIKRDFTLPIIFLSILVIIGLSQLYLGIFSLDGLSGSIGVIMTISGIFFLVILLNFPKDYGLELELNSGKSRIFITEDLEGVKKIVSELYEFMESESDEILTVNIDQSHAQIGVGYAEKINSQNISG